MREGIIRQRDVEPAERGWDGMGLSRVRISAPAHRRAEGVGIN